MVINDIIDTVKENILWIFKQVNEGFLLLTESFREFPEDPTEVSGWGSYLIFAFIIFIIPVSLAIILNCIMNTAVGYSVICFSQKFWKNRSKRNCICELIAEGFMILIFLMACGMVGLVCFTYFDLYEMKDYTFQMMELNLNTTTFDVFNVLPLSSFLTDVSIICVLVFLVAVFNCFSVVSVVQIFLGYYCCCGSTFWYVYLSACLSYCGVILYLILSGMFFTLFFWIQDFCRFEEIMWPHYDKMFGTFTPFTADLVNTCVNGTQILNNTLCPDYFSQVDQLICNDANYFFNGGMGFISIFVALAFFGLYWPVCYYGNSVRGDKDMDNQLNQKSKEVKKMLKAQERENYYFGFDDNNELEMEEMV